MLLVQVWTLGDNWLWLWQLIASLMLGCIATLLLLLYSSTGRNISSTLCPKRMEIDYYREWNSKVASTTESGAKDYYWILGLFQGKKTKMLQWWEKDRHKCASGPRIKLDWISSSILKRERIWIFIQTDVNNRSSIGFLVSIGKFEQWISSKID